MGSGFGLSCWVSEVLRYNASDMAFIGEAWLHYGGQVEGQRTEVSIVIPKLRSAIGLRTV